MIHSYLTQKDEFEKIAKGDKNYTFTTKNDDIKIGDYIGLNEASGYTATGRAILAKVTDINNSDRLDKNCCAVSFVPCFITCQDNIYTRKFDRLDIYRGYEIYNNTEAQP